MRLRLRRDKRPVFPWRAEYDALATYNGEKARGIVHTPEMDARMAQIQAEYNADLRRVGSS